MFLTFLVVSHSTKIPLDLIKERVSEGFGIRCSDLQNPSTYSTGEKPEPERMAVPEVGVI